MIGKYQKQPVVIEASLFDGSDDSAKEIEKWSDGVAAWHFANNTPDDSLHHNYLIILTLEGDMRADPGDYVIKGIHGEFYPCKPDIFDASYKEVKE